MDGGSEGIGECEFSDLLCWRDGRVWVLLYSVDGGFFFVFTVLYLIGLTTSVDGFFIRRGKKEMGIGVRSSRRKELNTDGSFCGEVRRLRLALRGGHHSFIPFLRLP